MTRLPYLADWVSYFSPTLDPSALPCMPHKAKNTGLPQGLCRCSFLSLRSPSPRYPLNSFSHFAQASHQIWLTAPCPSLLPISCLIPLGCASCHWTTVHFTYLCIVFCPIPLEVSSMRASIFACFVTIA